MAINPADFRTLLSIDPDNQLQLADSKSNKRRSEQSESHLLKELDPDSNLVAHYRVWTRKSSLAPYKTQRGWEKYSPDGSLLDREVRYSEQPTGITLH